MQGRFNRLKEGVGCAHYQKNSNSLGSSNLFHDSETQDKVWTLVARKQLQIYIATSEVRQIENEMIFRRINEKLIDGFDDLDAMHIDDDNIKLIRNDDMPLLLTCECSDENCVQRIAIKYSDYQEIHQDRRSFIVKPNHQVTLIEKVIQNKPKYNVVKKNKIVKEPGNKLNETSINNT